MPLSPFPLIDWLANAPPIRHSLPAPSLPGFWALTDVPDVIKRVSDSFPILAGNWIVWVCIATILALLTLTAGWFWFTGRRTTTGLNRDNPQRLFEELLSHLRLASDDRAVLRKMARGARLRHPTMSLLSPGLLNWSCKLWRQEKGARVVTPERIAQINAISRQLYDHVAGPNAAPGPTSPKESTPPATNTPTTQLDAHPQPSPLRLD